MALGGFAKLATFGMRFVAEDQVTATLGNLAKRFKIFNTVTGNGFNEVAKTIQAGGLRGKIAMASAGLVGQQLIQTINRLSAASVRFLGQMTKAAADFEQEMSKFGVIANSSAAELDILKAKILAVTAPLPTSATQVAKAATAFAKMGFAADQSAEALVGLASEAIMFGRAIGATDEQAAMFIGKLATWLQITDRSAESLGRVASMVTKLGWRIKGTAQDVIKATERFGAFVRAMGATEAQAVSLAGLVVDSGILIRRGSTAINRTFQLMASNANAFGDQMKKSGMVSSSKEFVKTLETDPVKAFETVLFALAKTGGIQATTMLKQLGLHGNYISDLITMSRNSSQLSKFIKETTAEFRKQDGELGATQKAFQAYTKTFNSAMKTLKGAWENILIVMGSPLLGVFTFLLTQLSETIAAMIGHWTGEWFLKILGGLVAVVTVGLLFLSVYTSVVALLGVLRLAGLATMAAWIKGFLIFLALAVALVAIVTIFVWLYRWLAGNASSFGDTLSDVTGKIQDTSTQVVDAATGGMGATPNVVSAVPATESVAMANGGIVDRPTRALIGESGPEAVVPLDDFAAMMNSFADRIVEAVRGAGGGDVNISAPIILDGQIVAQAVTKVNDFDDLRRGEIG